MPYTPVELRHISPKRAFLGYSRTEVDQLLLDTADSFEQVWRERGELTDRVEELDRRLDELMQRESLLSATLVAAEKAAVAAKEAARREAEIIVAEAHLEARTIMRGAQAERERLFGESRRVEALLRTALGVVGETGKPPVAFPVELAAPPAEADAEAAPSPAPSDRWPGRVDTREFEAIRPEPESPQGALVQVPPVQLPPVVEPDAEAPEPPVLKEFSWGD